MALCDLVKKEKRKKNKVERERTRERRENHFQNLTQSQSLSKSFRIWLAMKFLRKLSTHHIKTLSSS